MMLLLIQLYAHNVLSLIVMNGMVTFRVSYLELLSNRVDRELSLCLF